MADPSRVPPLPIQRPGVMISQKSNSPELTVVDLPHSRNKEAQDRRGTRVFHQRLLISVSLVGESSSAFNGQAVCREVERHESYSGTAGGVNGNWIERAIALRSSPVLN